MKDYKKLFERVRRLEKLYAYESKEDQKRLLDFLGKDYYDKYLLIKNKISNPEYKDIYKIIRKDINEVKDFIDKFISTSSVKKQNKEGARLIYNEKGWKVYRITTYEASQIYGRNTKWCISGNYDGHEERGEEYFHSYIEDNNLDGGYYFYIKSNNEKYCVLRKKDGFVHSIWDIKDNEIDYYDLPKDFPDLPNIITDNDIENLYSRDIDNVRSSINKGIDVNIDKPNGWKTPLINAVMNNYSTELVSLLLKKGADPNKMDDEEHTTALLWAVDNNNLLLAEILLKNGADPTSDGYEGASTLDFAIDNAKPDMKRLFLKYGYKV